MTREQAAKPLAEMNDRIEIRDLMLRTIIGVDQRERKDRQDIVLDIVLHTDTVAANSTDDPKLCLNYRAICDNVISMVEQSDYRLLTTFAEEVARICLKDRLVHEVVITTSQPRAM